ncbi:uncharacterized protein LOC126992305 isoform X6 [Eriocheir sinensis]|nr:uncharacterized protein LOC126992305 isoform X6 [Eriocheir sinensis]
MDLMVCGDPGCGGWLPHSLLQPLTAVPQEPDTICFTPAQTLPLTPNSCFILRCVVTWRVAATLTAPATHSCTSGARHHLLHSCPDFATHTQQLLHLKVCGDPGCGGWLPHSLLQPLTAVPQEPDTICFTPAQTLPLTPNSCFILRISDVELPPPQPPPPPLPPGEPLTATRRKEAGRRRRRKRRRHTEREEEEEEEEGLVIWQTSNQ